MKKIELGKTGLTVPPLAVGCMRINSVDKKQSDKLFYTAVENGFNFFDNADIYGGKDHRGECEEIFGEKLKENKSIRNKIIIQTKCGIRPFYSFAFSKKHIIESVGNSLKRMNTDYIDVLLLHRPDTLFDPDEVADAFSTLKKDGKVLHFGVSNENREQMELLQNSMDMPIAANQIQLSLVHCPAIQNGINFNLMNDSAVDRGTSGIIEFCRLNKITIQPWSPFQHGFFKGTFMSSPDYPELNNKLEEIAERHNSTPTSIVVAWYMRHPAKFQPVIGTMNPDRLLECIKGTDIVLTREEWYELYMAAGNVLP